MEIRPYTIVREAGQVRSAKGTGRSAPLKGYCSGWTCRSLQESMEQGGVESWREVSGGSCLCFVGPPEVAVCRSAVQHQPEEQDTGERTARQKPVCLSGHLTAISSV